MKTIDYTKRRKGVVRCPVCGRNGERLDIPMTRGKNAGRVRVTVYHVKVVEDLGVCLSVRDYEACYHWADDPATDTHRQALKGLE